MSLSEQRRRNRDGEIVGSAVRRLQNRRDHTSDFRAVRVRLQTYVDSIELIATKAREIPKTIHRGVERDKDGVVAVLCLAGTGTGLRDLLREHADNFQPHVVQLDVLADR